MSTKSTTYRGCTFAESGTTTDVWRSAFGRSYTTLGYVWGVSGRLSKPALQRPFLVSAAACREWVIEQDALREHYAREVT